MADFPRTAKVGSLMKQQPIARKVRNTLARRLEVNKEQQAMRSVRLDDRYCRFPLCGCRKFKLLLHVSHQKHRGMGGNPAGDRTVPELMILVCSARHRENAIAIDRGTLKWEPLNETLGARGPVRWLVDINRLRPDYAARNQEWFEVAREKFPHQLEPLNRKQRTLLERLAQMEE